MVTLCQMIPVCLSFPTLLALFLPGELQTLQGKLLPGWPWEGVCTETWPWEGDTEMNGRLEVEAQLTWTAEDGVCQHCWQGCRDFGAGSDLAVAWVTSKVALRRLPLAPGQAVLSRR